jgi:hypothetical protein
MIARLGVFGGYGSGSCRARWVVQPVPKPGQISQFTVRNEFDSVAAEGCSRVRRREYGELALARFAQACGGRAQVRVDITGVANKFPGAFRHCLCDGLEDLAIQTSSHDDAQGSVGSSQAGSSNTLSEVTGKAAHRTGLSVAFPQSFLCANEIGRDYIEGIAYRCYTAGPCRAQQAFQHDRKRVGVLVRIKVRDRDVVRLQLTNLRGGFGFDLIRIELAQECARGECRHTVLKVLRIVSRNQAGKTSRINQGLTIDENHMAADTPTSARLREFDSFPERTPTGHERRGTDHSTVVRLGDRAIHAMSQSEVVGVDDESAHVMSLAALRGQGSMIDSANDTGADFGSLAVHD